MILQARQLEVLQKVAACLAQKLGDEERLHQQFAQIGILGGSGRFIPNYCHLSNN